jgi:L-ascorbate metabolism protein UlaG (beta-lactamase superfamily)
VTLPYNNCMCEITWLGHGTFQLRFPGGQVALIDPWLDGNPSYPKDHQLDRLDLILITHGHFDHIGSVLELARRFRPQVIANYEICTWLAAQGVENTCGMNKGGTQQAGPIRVTMTHALHSSGISDNGQLIYGGEAGGYILHFSDGRSAYFAGDTAIFAEMQLYRELYAPQLAFLPIGDLFTMDPREAALAARLLGVKQVIPMHYGTFPPLTGRPEQLEALLQTHGAAAVWTLQAGHPVKW